MTREDICTCGQYSQCPTCGKSRSNYAELMKENERMREALETLRDVATRVKVWRPYYDVTRHLVKFVYHTATDALEVGEVTP